MPIIQQILQILQNRLRKTKIQTRNKTQTNPNNRKPKHANRQSPQTNINQTNNQQRNRTKTHRTMQPKSQRHRPKPQNHIPNNRQKWLTKNTKNKQQFNHNATKPHLRQQTKPKRQTIQRQRIQLRKMLQTNKKQTFRKTRQPNTKNHKSL